MRYGGSNLEEDGLRDRICNAGVTGPVVIGTTAKSPLPAPTAYRFALDSLTDGTSSRTHRSCYADALHVCHEFAVDQAASTGKITFFNLSSTVVLTKGDACEPGLILASVKPQSLALRRIVLA